MKKTGLGKGNWNGPGGKIDPGETPKECAVRELQEEISITPDDPQCRGILRFYFGKKAKADWYVYVFVAANFSGTPSESREAFPQWYPISEIPYDLMWEDDRYWLPLVLQGKSVSGDFVFSSDMKSLIDYNIQEEECAISTWIPASIHLANQNSQQALPASAKYRLPL